MSNLVSVPRNGSLVRNNSNATIPSISDWMEDFFNRDVPSLFSRNYNHGVSVPKVNIKETADFYLVEMAAPGLTKSDFQINLDNEVLTISADKENENLHEDESLLRREFGYSSFKRTFSLPDAVDEDKISAKYNDGVLTVQLPKKDEAKRKPIRNIKIS